MARVDISPDLDVRVANEIMAPRVALALRMMHESAQRFAPPCKVWISKRDNVVRKSHREADGQIVPANLRFRVPKVDTGDDANDVRAGFDLARMPRDPTLPIGNRINCRCEAPPLPHPLRDSLHVTPVTVIGTRVEGSVQTRFPRAAESEYGGGEGDVPALYMTRALRDAEMRLSAQHAR